MTATVVHAANQINNHTTSISCLMPATPTSGNLMVALVYTQQNSANNAFTVQSGWTQANPYANTPSFDYIWSTGPWGELSIFYKPLGGSESTTQTPLVVATDISSVVSMFELHGLSGTFDETFVQAAQIGTPLSNVYGDRDIGQTVVGDLPSDDGFHALAPSDTTLLVLTNIIVWGSLSEFIQTTTFEGPAFANLVTAENATTTDGWPIFGGPKTAAVVAFWDTVAPGDEKVLVGSYGSSHNGSVGFIAFDAVGSGGGGGGSDIIITTTVTASSVAPNTFRYTIINS